MKLNLRWITLIAGNILLLILTHMVNHSLSFLNLHIYLFAPFIIFPIIAMVPFTYGLVSILITALFYDAVEPLAFGNTFVFLALAYTTIFWFRNRFKAYSNRHIHIFTHSSNAAVILIISILNAGPLLQSFDFWVSTLVNITTSHVLLSVISPWFFELQYSLLKMSGFSSEVEGKNLV